MSPGGGNIVPVRHQVTAGERTTRAGHSGAVLCREENIRRIGEVASLFADAGAICITAFISPYRADRARTRDAAGGRRFFEVYVKSGLATCERRDPKGHYARARAGQIKDFTGVDAPYEAPEHPGIVIDTETQDIETCVAQLPEFVVSACRA